MKNILLLSLIAITLNATEYFTTIEPYEKHVISSQVEGKVTFIDKSKEYKFIDKNTPVIKLDTKDELIRINSLKHSIKLQKNLIAIKEQNYKNKAKVKQLSIYNKNQEKLYFLEAKQTLEQLQRDLLLQNNIIDKKIFNVKNRYIDKLLVSYDEYITVGTELFTLYDFSKLKLEIFVRDKEIDSIKNKTIFIDDKKSKFKIEKISQVRDEQRVSAYRVVLSKPNSNKNIYFGKVVKVEFK